MEHLSSSMVHASKAAEPALALSASRRFWLHCAPFLAAAPQKQALIRQRKKRKCSYRKAQLLYAYSKLVGEGTLAPCPELAGLLVKKSSKSQSGVLVITVLTSPYPKVTATLASAAAAEIGSNRVLRCQVGDKVQKFSCAWDCHYCPSEPGQPKSYLHEEPAVKRANENDFDPVLQLTDRAATLAMNGLPLASAGLT